MPFFWFMSSANGIKRISCKKFCFNVRLESNPRTRHTTRIHGAGCYSAEPRGIRMSKFPPLLLRKRATTSSLSQNLFCQLQVKGEWLAILESLKKEKQTRPIATTINQTNKVLLRAKNDIYIFVVSIWGSCLKLLRVAYASYLLHLHLYLFWWGSCLRVTLVSISTFTSSIVPAYLIPLGYVHKFCMMCLHVQFPEDMCTNSVLWLAWLVCGPCLHIQFL